MSRAQGQAQAPVLARQAPDPTPLREAVAREVFAPARRRGYPTRRVEVSSPDDVWTADLAELGGLTPGEKARFILIVIDVYSRLVWAVLLPDKKAATVRDAFQEVVSSATESGEHHPPTALWVDQGGEFVNKALEKLLREYGTTYGPHKAAIAERFIRTLRTGTHKLSIRTGISDLATLVDTFIHQYNRRPHSTTKVKPVDAYQKTATPHSRPEPESREYPQQDVIVPGTRVRVSRQRGVFEKEAVGNWSFELFLVKAVRPTNPVTYLLEDESGEPIDGAFYREELLPTRQPDGEYLTEIVGRRGNKVRVHYIGYDKKYDEWKDVRDLA